MESENFSIEIFLHEKNKALVCFVLHILNLACLLTYIILKGKDTYTHNIFLVNILYGREEA